MMKRSYTIVSDENAKQSDRSSNSSRMQRWSLALRRNWFSFTSGKYQKSTNCDFKIMTPVKIVFAEPEKTVLGYSCNGSSF
ncbi:Carboxypeptidase [Dirofilaria immitis]